MYYRRSQVQGGTYFFTINLLNRKSTLLIDEMNHFRNALQKVKTKHPFKIDALVVMPEHLHLLITLPERDLDYAKRISLLKSYFSRGIVLKSPISSSRRQKREKQIWQRRFWEHAIKNQRDFERHVDYIHYNPVKHGYVKRPVEAASIAIFS
jgi:putative transposase